MTSNRRLEAWTKRGILSERYAVVDEVFAERLHTEHTRTFESTRAEGQSFTSDIPNARDREVRQLDEAGLLTIGATVEPGTVIIGRVETRDEPKSAEEKLLLAIFGDAAGDVRDVSLRAPPGCYGKVVEAETDGESARVVVGWERPLAVGDVLEIDGDRVVVASIEPVGADVVWGRGGEQVRVAKVATARDVLHARCIGPYAEPHRQPVEKRDDHGAQRLLRGQAGVLAANAPWTLWEMFTLKSDDVAGRTRAFEALVKGANPGPGPPKPERARSSAESPETDGGILSPFDPRPDGIQLPNVVISLERLLQALGLSVEFTAPTIEAKLLDDDDVRDVSAGEVSVAATLEDGRPVPGGLHCQKVFGPVSDYECACGKYARMRHRGVVCEECGVEVISSHVRRERLGHLELALPCARPGGTWGVLPIAPPALRSVELNEAYLEVVEQNEALRSGSDTEDRLQNAVDEVMSVLATTIDDLWQSSVFTKPVDYSGVATLVVAGDVDPGTCRVPSSVVTELYRPGTYGTLEERGYVTTIKSAKEMVRLGLPEARRARRMVAEGAPILLAIGERFVARRVLTWDEAAVAVDEATADLLDGEVVTLHAPISWEAQIECAQLSDETAPRRRESDGWLARAIDASLVDAAVRAADGGVTDDVTDPLLAAALGRPPDHPGPEALEAWEAAERERRATIQREIDAVEAREREERIAAQPSPPPVLERPIGELEMSVATFDALRNAGIETIGELCRRTQAELLKTKHFGRKSLKEVIEALDALGLSLGRR